MAAAHSNSVKSTIEDDITSMKLAFNDDDRYS